MIMRMVVTKATTAAAATTTAAAAAAAAAAVVGGAREDAKVHLAGTQATADTQSATGADTVVWRFESAKQHAVMTLNAPLSAIREKGFQCGASILLRTCQ
eukprot:COSAG03_NODE_14778_length_452_cov_1.651558_1_plen_99_part_01